MATAQGDTIASAVTDRNGDRATQLRAEMKKQQGNIWQGGLQQSGPWTENIFLWGSNPLRTCLEVSHAKHTFIQNTNALEGMTNFAIENTRCSINMNF